jgi:hypothetical protein
MSNRPTPRKRDFAFYGAGLGLVVGIGHAYVHAFWGQAYGHNEIEHTLWRMAGFIGGGAALSAAIAVIHNWLVRKP